MTSFDTGLLDPTTGAAEEADDRAVLRAMVDVEAAHLDALVAAAVASGSVRWSVDDLDLHALTAASAAGGNPVIPLVAELRRRAPGSLADAVHLGLTSQDVLDSALMLVAARSIRRASESTDRVLDGLGELAEAHRTTPVAGRTLGRQAAPTTVGLRWSVLLDGVARTRRALEAADLPLQLGGSVGTLAVLTDRIGEDGTEALRAGVAAALGLAARQGVWHVERSAVALLGAAIAAHLGALGRIGLEVVQGSRPEIGELELAVGAGEGGSSAMPQKQNPVAAVLLVANARRAPGLAATLLGAQLALDDRPAGDWHAEWQTLRELLRLLLESAVLAERLIPALGVDVARSRANLDDGDGSIHAERAQQVLARRVGRSRAAELTRDALAEDDFVAAIRRAAADDPSVDAETRDRLAAATTAGGPVGLSDRLIDASVAGAQEVDR